MREASRTAHLTSNWFGKLGLEIGEDATFLPFEIGVTLMRHETLGLASRIRHCVFYDGDRSRGKFRLAL